MPGTAKTPDFRLRLDLLYGDRADGAAQQVQALVAEYQATSDPIERPEGEPWDERDVVLITYADQLRSAGQPPLAVLRDWLQSSGLDELLSVVHLLPFCPSSSDDGFSVIDYLQVDPAAGDWDDIARLSERCDLMFDLVLNHISRQSAWFQKYLAGESPYDRFFIDVEPQTDLSRVVRPRSSPLLTPVETSRGEKHAWTTFSDDQIDLNYAEPEVLLRMLRVLLEYARRGARIIRLDAVAFLWKRIGSDCLHLRETHEVVKLMRDVVTAAFPRVLLLTETNVPHAENFSYFGDGDEAHMIYQFSLPPLLLDAFVSGDAIYLRNWLASLASPPAGCTFFNFTASHDGIGVRPLEGLVPDERFHRVIEAVRARGGLINTRRTAMGEDVPYELNITYVDALAPTEKDELPDDELHARRFLTSQAVMLALPGVPAVYFHSLVGTQNDYRGVEQSGINRRINRHKYDRDELDAHLRAAGSLASRIYAGCRELLAVRRQLSAFHPDAPVQLVDRAPDGMLVFERVSRSTGERVLAVANFGNEDLVDLGVLMDAPDGKWHSVLSVGSELRHGRLLTLKPGACAWLLAE